MDGIRRRPVVIGALFALVCLAGYIELAEDFGYSASVARFDAQWSGALQALRSPALTAVMRVVTSTGGIIGGTLITLAVVLGLVSRRHGIEARVVAATTVGGVLLSTLFKAAFGRPRPPAVGALVDLPISSSFPSGHTMMSLTLAIAVAWVALRLGARTSVRAAVIVLLAVWAAAVAASRIYLGVHWPSDVIASWLLGGAWAALVIGVAEAFSRPRSPEVG